MLQLVFKIYLETKLNVPKESNTLEGKDTGEDTPKNGLGFKNLLYWIKHDEIYDSRFMFKVTYVFKLCVHVW